MSDSKTLLAHTGQVPVVDFNFVESHPPLELGEVPVLQAVDESRLDEYIRDSVSKPSGCSVFARTCTCIASAATVVGAIALFAKIKMIKPDEIGLARGFNGNVYVLSPGCNLTQTFFRDVHVFKKSNNNIKLHPMHIIRILPGHYGLCRFDGVPYVMAPGRHFINDPLFQFVGTQPATKANISHGTIHIIIVDTGKVGVGVVKGVGHLLEPGRHFINNPDFQFKGVVDANAEYINSCSKHRILIPMGKVGLGWRKNEAILMEANKAYFIDDADFKYQGSVSLLQEQIEHGAFKIITVNKGLVGVAFDDGALTILQPGRHIVDRETFNFSAMLSTGQETIPISEIVNLSSDNVGLRFSAALNIQVIDARKAVTMLGRDLSRVKDTRARKATEFSSSVFQNNIRDRARLALSIIIGNNPFTETFLSTSAIASVHGEGEGDGKDGESFKGIIHDAFMSKFSKEMTEQCGVRVLDMSIADIDIVNKELSHALAQAAVKATELEMAKIDRNVETQRAETDVKSMKIRAEGEGAALLVDANAASEEITIIAQAEADRILGIDKALSGTSEATQTRELIVASGDTMAASSSAIVCANSASHLSLMLSGKSSSGGKRK